jgi:hypothetical protein
MKLKHPQYMESAWRNRPDTKVNGYFQLADNAVVSHNATQVTFATHVGPAGEVIVAPHGSLSVYGDGGRNPDWRQEMRRLFGVDFDLAKTFAGKLFCPHTGQKVQVSRIEGNPELWADYEHKVALAAGQITYASPDAPPVRTEKRLLKYSVVNRKRTKDVTTRWKRLINEAKLRLKMMEPLLLSPIGLIPMLDALVKNPDVVDIESVVRISQPLMNAAPDELLRTYQVCRMLVSNAERNDLKEKISYACADHYTSPYLEYRP